MRNWFGPLALVLAVGAAAAADPPVRLPADCPAEPAAPAVVPKLAPDRLYMLDSDVELVVLSSPKGLVRVTAEPGPLRVRGRFVDGGGKTETREYKGKFVYSVEAAATGRVELLVAPVGLKGEAEVVRRTLYADAGEPPPDDGKGKPPVVDPKPAPRAVKLKAVVVEETADATAKRAEFFTDKALAERWKAKGHAAPVVVDQNVKDPVTKTTPDKLKPYVDRAKGKTLPQLYLVDLATNAVLYEGPAPATPAELISILDRIGG
jgi:hypothetical protein